MTGYNTVVMVDWSGGNDTGPSPRKDAIWACVVREGVTQAPVYLRNRGQAEDWLSDLIATEVASGRRVLAGFDFPFGYPQGFARAATGSDDPLVLWDWFARELDDRPDGNNRFDLAARLNTVFPDIGPFWFNGLKRDIPGLPRKGTDRSFQGLSEKRLVETQDGAKGSFSCWQMGGAGAVGSQVMTGIATLSRLRHTHAGMVAVWPFEDLDRPVAFVEIWPSLIADVVAEAMADDPETVKDAAQVRLLAKAIAQAQSGGTLTPMLGAVPDGPARREEGWILGAGFEAELRRAARAAAHPDLVPPRLSNDCFAMPQGVVWTPVEDALALLRARLHRVVGQETVTTAQALDRVLAHDHLAVRANPPGPNSAVDGYGFAASSTGAGRQVMPLLNGRAAAGAPFGGTVPDGSGLRVLTGALLPQGVDTVVLQEDVTTETGFVAFDGPIKAGANTRKAGEDLNSGEVALSKGRRVTPADIGLLSAVGCADVSVFKQLRVGVLSTGDEIVPSGSTFDPGKTFDANRPMLLAVAARWGYAPVDLGHVGDDPTALSQALDRAADLADVVLTSGGASAGEEDHVSALLASTGSLQSWRIALKPGRPLALGIWRGVPVFGLPGNPVAALVCTLIFARPALACMAGTGWSEPTGMMVPAAFEKQKKPGRREYLRARLDTQGRAEVFASEGSGRISGLSWAEGLVELGDGAQNVKAGDPVRYLPYGSFGL